MNNQKKIVLLVFTLILSASLFYNIFLVNNSVEKGTNSTVLLLIEGENIESENISKIKEMMKTGVYGNISLDIENYSPTYWTTAATGVKPEKHGITDWKKGDRFVTSQDVEVDSIWNILSRKGFQVGVFNWMVTWPPESVNGFMVSGGPILSDNITYPPELRQQLDKNIKSMDNLGYLIEKYRPNITIVGITNINETYNQNQTLENNLNNNIEKLIDIKERKSDPTIFVIIIDQETGGKFLAKGPTIKNGVPINDNIKLEDIAPTILYKNNKKLSSSMHGQPIIEIFENDLIHIIDDERVQEIEERLKNLGYEV